MFERPGVIHIGTKRIRNTEMSDVAGIGCQTEIGKSQRTDYLRDKTITRKRLLMLCRIDPEGRIETDKQ